MTNPIIYVCDSCGSVDVSDNRVTGYWDATTQKWTYEHYDSTIHCYNCSDEGGFWQLPYDPYRFKLTEADFDVGDVVRFEEDVKVYDDLVGNNHIPDKPELALAVVVEESDTNKKAKTYNDFRDTVLVRLMTGELVEVWPRDLVKVEEK